jgi:hypothetical protein
MWGEVIEHQYGWRSEYAAVRAIVEITGDISFQTKHWLLLELREKYRCTVVTELWAARGDWNRLARMDEGVLARLMACLDQNYAIPCGWYTAKDQLLPYQKQRTAALPARRLFYSLFSVVSRALQTGVKFGVKTLFSGFFSLRICI